VTGDNFVLASLQFSKNNDNNDRNDNNKDQGWERSAMWSDEGLRDAAGERLNLRLQNNCNRGSVSCISFVWGFDAPTDFWRPNLIDILL
jgi:hypothetical protein